MNNIKIPTNLDDFIENCVEKVYEEEKLKKMKRRKIVSIIAASFIAVFTLFGISNSALAAKMSVIGSVFEFFDININTRFKENSEEVNKVAKYKGYSVTMSKIASDEKTLYVEYTIKSDKKFENVETNKLIDFLLSSNLSIVSNGKEEVIDGYTTVKGYFLDEYTFAGFGEYSLDRTSLKVGDSAVFKANIIAIPKGYIEDRNGDNMVQGNWKLESNFQAKSSVLVNKEIENKVTNGYSISKIEESPFKIFVEITTSKKYRKHEKEGEVKQTIVKPGQITESFWVNFKDQNGGWINPIRDEQYIQGNNGELVIRYTIDRVSIPRDVTALQVAIEDEILAVQHDCEKHEEDPQCIKTDLEPQKKFNLEEKITINN